MSDYLEAKGNEEYLSKKAKILKLNGYSVWLFGRTGTIISVNEKLFLKFDSHKKEDNLNEGCYLTLGSFELLHCKSKHVKKVKTEYGKEILVCRHCGVIE